MTCVCRMPPGHSLPNQEQFLLDHRCVEHGERAQPQVWGRHKDLELLIKVPTYEALAKPPSCPYALRQIYRIAIDLERGRAEESLTETAQNIQRLCDAALRGQPVPAIYKPVDKP